VRSAVRWRLPLRSLRAGFGLLDLLEFRFSPLGLFACFLFLSRPFLSFGVFQVLQGILREGTNAVIRVLERCHEVWPGAPVPDLSEGFGGVQANVSHAVFQQRKEWFHSQRTLLFAERRCCGLANPRV
jgi:hypothetical protein